MGTNCQIALQPCTLGSDFLDISPPLFDLTLNLFLFVIHALVHSVHHGISESSKQSHCKEKLFS